MGIVLLVGVEIGEQVLLRLIKSAASMIGLGVVKIMEVRVLFVGIKKIV